MVSRPVEQGIPKAKIVEIDFGGGGHLGQFLLDVSEKRLHQMNVVAFFQHIQVVVYGFGRSNLHHFWKARCD
jgi:hypothetical protein